MTFLMSWDRYMLMETNLTDQAIALICSQVIFIIDNLSQPAKQWTRLDFWMTSGVTICANSVKHLEKFSDAGL